MKKFLATAVFCLALVPTGTFASHTVFPDGNAMALAVTVMPTSTPGPFTVCSPSTAWAKLYSLNVNNMNTLFPLHIRTLASCLVTSGGLAVGSVADSDLYGPAAPTITDTGTAYTVAWAVQVYAGGTWSPAGTFTLTVTKTNL